MVSNPSGILIDDSFTHLSKACPPISLVLSGRMTTCRLAHLRKALTGITSSSSIKQSPSALFAYACPPGTNLAFLRSSLLSAPFGCLPETVYPAISRSKRRSVPFISPLIVSSVIVSFSLSSIIKCKEPAFSTVTSFFLEPIPNIFYTFNFLQRYEK